MHGSQRRPDRWLTSHVDDHAAWGRRTLLRLGAIAGAGLLLPGCFRESEDAARAAPATTMMRFPGKTELILLTDRPPQLETPLRYYRQDFTPNEAFYVRWHLSGLPGSVDIRTFTLSITGHCERPLSLSLEDLRSRFDPFEVIAVNQCSGNGRSMYQPRVPGGQWGNGAVGNARWTGVRLKDLLDRAGLKPGAVSVSFQGLDRPPLPSTPSYIKALSAEHAQDGEVMVAYAMNGEPLPMLNGFPLRLVVPGWYATYWVKALSDITVLDHAFSGFWMDKAYRIPTTLDAQESPDHLATETVPINRMSVRSLFVRPEPEERLERHQAYPVEGIAIDSGIGIERVEVTSDAGATWKLATLDPAIGRYSWRRWRLPWTPTAPGSARLMVRAVDRSGRSQTSAQWNRSGYARNAIEHVDVTVS